jgi:hypothetical protein
MGCLLLHGYAPFGAGHGVANGWFGRTDVTATMTNGFTKCEDSKNI